MSSTSVKRQQPSATPEILRVPDQGIVIQYPAVADATKQTILFKQWNALGATAALEVASAFIDLFSHYSKHARRTTNVQLNKLCRFMSERKIESLTDLTDEHVDAFRAFLEPVPSTRRRSWSVACRVIRHAYGQTKREPPMMNASPWTRRAPEWNDAALAASGPSKGVQRAEGAQSVASPPNVRKSSRARLAAISVTRVIAVEEAPVAKLDPDPTLMREGGSLVVFFPARGSAPAHRQQLTDWAKFDRRLAEEVAAAVVALKRNNAWKSVRTWLAAIRKLLRYLEGLDEDRRPASLSSLDAEHVAGFIRAIDKGDVATRAKAFCATVALVRQVCQAHGRSCYPQVGMSPLCEVGMSPVTAWLLRGGDARRGFGDERVGA